MQKQTGSLDGGPLQRVREYLRKLLGEGQVGDRLPTTQRLAEHLGVGTRTVQRAIREGVSEGWLRTRPGSGTYLSEVGAGEYRIGVNWPLETDKPPEPWLDTISGSLIRSALQSGKPYRFVRLEPEGGEDLDAVVLLPSPHPQHESLRERGVRCVHINPPSVTSTTDFVSPDYVGAARELGRVWAETGRRHILLLQSLPLDQSVSSQLRLGGLAAGIGMSGRTDVRLSSLNAGAVLGSQVRRALEDWLNRGEMPDAIFCTGDFLAVEAYLVLRGRGVSVPGEVSLVGGSGLELAGIGYGNLTRTQQPLTRMGEELFGMLERVLETGGASQPGVYLPTPLIGGGTTTQEENEALDIAQPLLSTP